MGTQEGKKFPISIIVGFQQRDRHDSQNLNNDTFSRAPLTSCQCIVGFGRNPDGSIFLNYDDDDFRQVYGQIKEAFRALTKDDIFKPYISDKDFRSFNDENDIAYLLWLCFGANKQITFYKHWWSTSLWSSLGLVFSQHLYIFHC